MENFLLEKSIVKAGTVPVDFNDAAVTGVRVDIKNLKRLTFVVLLGAGTATSAHTFTLKQHDAASAGTTADLSVDNPYFHKIGAATSFTKVQPSSAAADYDLHAILANSASVVVFEVLPEQLTEGYRWVSLNVTDAGGAQLGSILALGESEFAPAYSQVI